MIRKIAVTAFILLLGACQATAPMKSPVTYSPDYARAVNSVVKGVCLDNLGATDGMYAALEEIGAPLVEVDEIGKYRKIRKYAAPNEDGRVVAIVSVTSNGSVCGVAWKRSRIPYDQVVDNLDGVTMLDGLHSHLLVGYSNDRKYAVLVGSVKNLTEPDADIVIFLSDRAYKDQRQYIKLPEIDLK
ncbi:hypothetical protein [Thalassospira aquimaris]|uniref:Uncharacterized protein n=1 Tax=Thalassospira aquimaris TaxID=3037796 RepID=A0ABT6GHS2_9PROT|nr:hypothetical protein [Thalassospira sp. FZY0004]MDG4721596.1 hypothetical protein [Thalassospira sp. FZY0004]